MLADFEPPFPILVESILLEVLSVIGSKKTVYFINFADEMKTNEIGIFQCFLELLKNNGYVKIEKRITKDVLPLLKKKNEDFQGEINTTLYILRDLD